MTGREATEKVVGRTEYPPIEDYALIGDSRSAGLVSRGGSLDWLCLPSFDSPSQFAALLDRERGGRFVVRPAGVRDVRRRYLPDTNVLETTFTTESGRLRLLDFMPVTSEAVKRRELLPEHELIRLTECVEGRVELHVVYDPRPDYGTEVPRIRRRRRGEYWCGGGRGAALVLSSELTLEPRETSPGLAGREVLHESESRALALTYARGEPAVLPGLGTEAWRKARRTARWWRQWAEECDYRGRYRDAVVRSALVLKLLTFAPSGAVVAAPTTSLPERIGGVRNWDYRYCWLRDASLIYQVLMDLDRAPEARSFVHWMLHSTRLTRPELQVLYDVYGNRRTRERELDHLDGYRGSRPVRIGNGAADQLQLDTYGEVVDAAYQYACREGEISRDAARLLVGLGEVACDRWQEPDEGIWEIRGERRHHTFSKAMCWVALDRLLELDGEGLVDAPTRRFLRERGRIRDVIEDRGFSETLSSYTATLGGEQVDASLLLLSRYGYTDPDSRRMRSTCRAIRDRLGTGELLYRYRDLDDGLPGGEGAFGICSFWAAECRCRQGDLDGARRTFEALCRRANDVGLFAEQIDPESGAHLGNFPQAFTHVGLIDTALTMDRASESDEAESELRPPRPGLEEAAS